MNGDADRLMRWAVTLFAACGVGYFYLWAVRASGPGFEWGRDLDGFYDDLGRAFVQHHLYLPIQPRPELLALPNPWDPAVGAQYRIDDLALYKRRYYLYHGAGPALFLFAPWRLVTQHDLPENFAVFLLSLGGFLFSCGLLLRILDLLGVNPGPALWALLLIALGVCQGLPYLFNRIFVYEVAIAGGYLFVSAALFFLACAIPSGNMYCFATSGLMFGIAVACRPNLVFAAGTALAALLLYLAKSNRTREIIPFIVPLLGVGLAIATYNYIRFGNPFEFGVNYLLGGNKDQNRIKPALGYLLPGLYFFLLCAPAFSRVFPWVRIVFRFPFDTFKYPFPKGYFIEPTAGAMYLAPFLVAAFFLPRRDPLQRADPSHFLAGRMLLRTMLASSIVLLLAIATTGFTTQRYEVDFLPGLVLVALVNFAHYLERSKGLKRHLVAALLIVLIAYSTVINLAFGISGPYDGMLKNHPRRYMRLAGWFSVFPEFRPLLNPYVSVNFAAEFMPRDEDFREPLVTLGGVDPDFVYVEHREGALRIVSRSGASTIMHELRSLDHELVHFEVTYSPDSRILTTKLNGQEILSQPLPMLLTAPAEVTIGENRIDPYLTSRRFTGRMSDEHKTIQSRQR